MNNVTLVGRLTRDPETKYTGDGVAIANFGLAVPRPYKNAAGEKETDFLNCVAFRQTAEFVSQYLTKGRQIALRGSVQSRKYTTAEGQNRTVIEVVADQVESVGPRPEEGTAIEGGRAANTTTVADPFDEDPFSEG